MDPSSVSIICKRTVVSTKPVQPGKYFPLSVLDRFMENNHIRMVHYYKTLGEKRKIGELTKKLRESLSEVLTYFPAVTGRLVRDDERGHWKVKCNDAGVRMLEAKAKGSVEGWLNNVDREKELMLVYWEGMVHHNTYYWSTFYVQLTEFEEGGLAIGLSCTHLLADPTCATMFIQAWADISLGSKMLAPPILHSLPPRSPGNKKPNHHPYMELINHYKSSIEKPISVLKGERYTTISLGFSDHMVQACIFMAKPTSPSSPTPTPFEALSALFWVTLSKIKGLRSGLVDMSICLDLRKVLGLDHGFFGNCMLYNKVHHTEGNLVEKSNFSQAASAIRDVKEKMDTEGTIDLIEWLENNNGSINSPTMMNSHDLICASLEGQDPYLAMFDQDWSKPVRVSCYIEPVLGEGQVLILPAPHEEGPLGRVAMVTLKEEEANMLCEDEFILQLSPTILMKCN